MKVKPSTPKDNAERIARVITGKKGYDYLKRRCGRGCQQSLRDLLTDIRHFAAENKLDMDAALEGSEEVFQEESPLRDQNGDAVPEDLVLLPNADSDDDANIVLEAVWYEAENGVLMASAKVLKGLSEDDPADAAVDMAMTEIKRVDHCLNRWSKEDGFYHA